MKSAIIADIHWGIRNDHAWYMEKQTTFFNEIFFPYIENNKDIKNVFVLGDWFDRRKFVNYKTLQTSKKILEKLIEITPNMVYMLVGNHDTYYKSTNELNSLTELFGRMKVRIIDQIEEVEIGGSKFLFVPWIFGSIADETAEHIEKSSADYCCGHFELKGARMMDGIVCQHGFGTSLFENFEHVFTGHFHRPSDYANISYIGSPVQYSWNEHDEEKRFLVLDHATGSIEKILTGDHIFVKMYYNDGNVRSVPETKNFHDKILKVIVESKNDPYIFDQFIKKIEAEEPQKIDVIEQHLYTNTNDDQEVMDRDTLSIMMDSVDEMSLSTEEIYNIKIHINSIYSEALGVK